MICNLSKIIAPYAAKSQVRGRNPARAAPSIAAAHTTGEVAAHPERALLGSSSALDGHARQPRQRNGVAMRPATVLTRQPEATWRDRAARVGHAANGASA